MQRKMLFISLFLIGWGFLIAGTPTYSYHQISKKEGLSQSSVQSILTDSKGMLWIGTQNGLNRYAQQQLKTYYHQPEETTSLPHNHILHLAEDAEGNIWVSTSNGIALYTHQKDAFTLVSRTPAYSSLPIEGGILLGGDNVILRYDYCRKNMERIYLNDEKTTQDPRPYRIQSLQAFGKNKVLASTRQKGLYLLDLTTGRFSSLAKFQRQVLTSAYQASDGYIYTAHYGAGFFRFNKEGKQLKRFYTGNSALTNNFVMDLIEHEGKLWIATDGGGINLLSLSDDSLTCLKQEPGNARSLPDNSIIRLYKDQAGQLWAGGVREGIFLIKQNHIHTFQDAPLGISYGLSKKTVNDWYQEADGSVWIGTDGGGINHYSPHTGRFTHYPTTFGDKVSSITAYSNDELLVTIYTRGMFLFDKQTGRYRSFRIVNDSINREECNFGYVPMGHRINDDKIYLLSYHSWVYSLSEDKFRPIRPAQQGLPDIGFRLAYANDSIALFRAKNKVFLCRLDTDTYDFCFETGTEENICALFMDYQGRIWTGTSQGLGYFDRNTQQYHRLKTGLFNSISYLTADAQNRLWICAQNRLFTYDTDNERFRVWSPSDGFIPNEILPSYQRPNNPNLLYLGGTEGLVCIRPNQAFTDNDNPEIYLTGLQMDGANHPSKDGENGVSIPWNYHSFSASIQVKNKDVFQKNLIRYIIREGSQERSFETYETTLNLPTLSAGSYSIWASCNRKDGSFIEPVHLTDLRITPPWYKQPWFLALTGILAATGIAWLFIRFIRKRNQDVLRKIDSYKELMSEENVNFLKDIHQELSISPANTLSTRDQEFLEKFNTLVCENLATEDISVEFLTDRLAMSRASLYNKVKQLTGLGVNDYLNRLRIEQAVELLLHTDKAINDIASEVGFTYPRYFSTLFKKMKRVTPSQFKERQSESHSSPNPPNL